jgi:hypothetical protein
MAKKKKNLVTSIADVAKLYATRKGGDVAATDLRDFTEWKNFGLNDLMEGVFAKTQQKATKVGVYLTQKQAKKFSSVVDYAKSLGVDVGVAKAGMKNRPYDISVTGNAGSGQNLPGRLGGGTRTASTPAGEDSSGIANKIIAEIGKKRTKYGDY